MITGNPICKDKFFRITLYTVLLAAAALLLGSCANPGTVQYPATWKNVGYAGFSAGESRAIYIVFGPNDTPYVVFEDHSMNGKATVMQYSGGSWNVVGSPGFTSGSVTKPRIAVDSTGTVYVAFEDDTNPARRAATVMKYDGSWAVAGSAGFTDPFVRYLDIAVSGNDVPYVVYADPANNNRYAKVEKLSAGSWSVVSKKAQALTQNAAYDIRISFSGNTPYLTFIRPSLGNRATVMKYTGSTNENHEVQDDGWEYEGTAYVSADDAWDTRIAISGGGVPYVAYQDEAHGSKVTVKRFSSGSWSTVGAPGFTSPKPLNLELALGPNATPYVAFKDDAYNHRITVMKYDGVEWGTLGGKGIFATDSLDLAVNSRNVPYLAFEDFKKDEEVSVRRYE